MISLKTPLSESDVAKLKVGDIVYLSGIVVTARDRAHERALKDGKFPVDIRGGVIFHAGPVVKKEDGRWRIVAIGPTTSSRMNPVEAEFIKKFGVGGIIGKAGMSREVADAMENKAVYLAMTGGCAAIAANAVKNVIAVYWLDLGIPEAVWVLDVSRLGPLIVGIDSHGSSLYEKVNKKVRENIAGITQIIF
ncbi:MAG: fumarate hydratase C-terminal domain-containing protein [Candidatus Altiarchaeales archaeon]|nr:fumarate hydratase C-terminal domain-containing protein [Candidatus Altiarchaeales archaeon]